MAEQEIFERLDRETCDRARLARDPAFDGLFFTAVRTTRIYCRPICPVRPARSHNVVFFPTAAAAERAGFRPCLRCRPETAPGSPAWAGTATTVGRGLRLIAEGFLDAHSVADLAEVLGIGPRHLLRLFMRHAGATPSEVAATRRVQSAKRLTEQTDLPLAEVAFAAGFTSVRRFNDAFFETYRRSLLISQTTQDFANNQGDRAIGRSTGSARVSSGKFTRNQTQAPMRMAKDWAAPHLGID
jgi:AraC family transcriptional regulator, regulatory protein of adaptative response / methylated-DNA-[protein]-cysteine methyltransferase